MVTLFQTLNTLVQPGKLIPNVAVCVCMLCVCCVCVCLYGVCVCVCVLECVYVCVYESVYVRHAKCLAFLLALPAF